MHSSRGAKILMQIMLELIKSRAATQILHLNVIKRVSIMRFLNKNMTVAALCVSGAATLASSAQLAFKLYQCRNIEQKTVEECEESVKMYTAICLMAMLASITIAKTVYDLEFAEPEGNELRPQRL